MDKKIRSAGAGNKVIQTPSSLKITTDSQQAGVGSEATWINERGEICIGSKCFTLAINPDAKEVTISVDRNECGADLQPIVDSIFEVIGKGGRTLYESKSVLKEVKPK